MGFADEKQPVCCVFTVAIIVVNYAMLRYSKIEIRREFHLPAQLWPCQDSKI
jgi:hypothetical protein